MVGGQSDFCSSTLPPLSPNSSVFGSPLAPPPSTAPLRPLAPQSDPGQRQLSTSRRPSGGAGGMRRLRELGPAAAAASDKSTDSAAPTTSPRFPRRLAPLEDEGADADLPRVEVVQHGGLTPEQVELFKQCVMGGLTAADIGAHMRDNFPQSAWSVLRCASDLCDIDLESSGFAELKTPGFTFTIMANEKLPEPEADGRPHR